MFNPDYFLTTIVQLSYHQSLISIELRNQQLTSLLLDGLKAEIPEIECPKMDVYGNVYFG